MAEEKKSWWRNLFPAAIAGGIARTVTSPLEAIKTKLQMSSIVESSLTRTSAPAMQATRLHHYWSGNCLGATKSALEIGVKLASYARAKEVLGSGKQETSVEKLAAGSIAGAASTTLTQPIESFATRYEVMKTTRPNIRASGAFRELWRNEGLKAFLRGYASAMLSITPCLAVELAVYDRLKRRHSEKKESLSLPAAMGLGAVSSSTAVVCTYPLILMRTLMQANVAGDRYRDILKAVLKRKGIRGLYSGCGVKLVKYVPVTAISYLAYEWINRRLGIDG